MGLDAALRPVRYFSDALFVFEQQPPHAPLKRKRGVFFSLRRSPGASVFLKPPLNPGRTQ